MAGLPFPDFLYVADVSGDLFTEVIHGLDRGGVEALGSWVAGIMPEGAFEHLVNGVIAGVGGVIVFLPNILILFFFISLMEDTGYRQGLPLLWTDDA